MWNSVGLSMQWAHARHMWECEWQHASAERHFVPCSCPKNTCSWGALNLWPSSVVLFSSAFMCSKICFLVKIGDIMQWPTMSHTFDQCQWNGFLPPFVTTVDQLFVALSGLCFAWTDLHTLPSQKPSPHNGWFWSFANNSWALHLSHFLTNWVGNWTTQQKWMIGPLVSAM